MTQEGFVESNAVVQVGSWGALLLVTRIVSQTSHLHSQRRGVTRIFALIQAECFMQMKDYFYTNHSIECFMQMKGYSYTNHSTVLHAIEGLSLH